MSLLIILKVFSLNSNLILLILFPVGKALAVSLYFKFQSDSINTQSKRKVPNLNSSLNSNLILLIHHILTFHRMLQTTLNSNLILLIPVPAIKKMPFADYFKFQSDSINTTAQGSIRNPFFIFKFQSDSINTQCSHQETAG